MSAAIPSDPVRIHELRPRQRRALETLVLSGDLAAAAAAGNVTARTLRRWRATPSWRAEYQDAVRAIAEDAKGDLLAASSEAVAQLRAGLHRGSDADRARCARFIVNAVVDLIDADIEDRLQELERRVEQPWSGPGVNVV